MTNAMIIMNESLRLMEEGILKGSGQYGQLVKEDGTTETIEFPEEIHTFAGWKQLGFSVKKGEKSTIKFSIWKHTTKMLPTDTDNAETNKMNEEINREGGQENMFMKLSSWFTAAQVEPIKEK